MSRFSDYPWLHWYQQRPESIAVRLDEGEVTWQQLLADINLQAIQFSQKGVDGGKGVILRGKNSYALLIRYLAVLQLGARVLPVNPHLPQLLMGHLVSELNIGFGWNSEGQEHAPAWLLSLSYLPDNAVNTQDTANIAKLAWSEHRPATMTLTSGSSGMPKAVVHALSAHLANADGLLERMSFTSDDSWLLSLPLFHVSGQSIVWRWLSKGATLVLKDMASLADALKGCTHASLVPTQLWRLLSQSEFELSLKQVLLGGAMIPVELTRQAEARGIHCWCGYGLTEMAATVCAKRADNLPGVGTLLPYRQMKLENGEICLKGACLALGYWKNKTIIPLIDSDGWFHTRDKGVIEHDELRILGRLDNQFFSAGEGIQPEDIERVLMEHPLIEQVFIVPVDDAEFGQRPVAVIETSAPLSLEQLLLWLNGKVASFQKPVSCFQLPDELKQSGIKISRKALYEWVKQQKR